MASTVQAQTMTADELLRLPDDHKRHELIEGELRTMEPAGALHGAVAVRAGGLLDNHVREHRLGRTFGAETGFLIGRDPDTVRAPDAAFVSAERLATVGLTEGYWLSAPDLAVEVVSPGDTFTDVEEKALAWLAAGARLVLAVDPRRQTATAYRSPSDIRVLGASDTLDAGEVVPGWVLPVGELFT